MPTLNNTKLCLCLFQSKVIRVLNLWQKNAVFDSEVIQPLFDLADPNHPVHKDQAALAPTNGITAAKPVPAVNVTPKNGKWNFLITIK